MSLPKVFWRAFVLSMFATTSVVGFARIGFRRHAKTPGELRADYIASLQQRNMLPYNEGTVGSLWAPQGPLAGFSVDYKASHVNDTITIQIAVQTTATQSGTVDRERSFMTNSAVTGILGKAPASLNPLLSANSTSSLKGQGSTASNTLFATSMTGQVIAVLPNGNLVVEAARQIFMNNQHENVTLRGMIRPGDIGPNNTVPSTAFSNLEIEMKGKGIISDGVHPPNAITRAVLWLLNF